MIGIEVVGLALAVFPIAIKEVERYKGVITGRDIRHLADSLKNNERIFTNSVENLLRSVVWTSELAVLLGDLHGDAWRDDNLRQKVTKHLGQDADDILLKIKEIHGTVSQLQRKLPVSNKTYIWCFQTCLVTNFRTETTMNPRSNVPAMS